MSSRQPLAGPTPSPLLRAALRLLLLLALAAAPAHAATIPGLYPTGVDHQGALLPAGAIDPHYRLVGSADPDSPGPNAFVVQEGFPIPPWIANGPDSKWIAPRANQSGGNLEGDYTYRLQFDLTGLDPFTAVITGRWSTDNAGVAIRLNGEFTGISGDGNFQAWSPSFAIRHGFIDGVNTIEFVVNNAPSGANPTGLRVELSGAADPDLPPGIAPTIVTPPTDAYVPLLDPASFRVAARGSKPLSYQWRFQGQPLANATTPTLQIPSVTTAHAGFYDVIVANAAGAITSSPARLSITFLAPDQLPAEPPGPSSRRTGLAITEIMYHPAPRADHLNLEFVELYNSNPFPEDLSRYRLSGDIDFEFPAGTSLPGRSYLVIAASPTDFESAYGISGALGGFTTRLSNGGGILRLRKPSGAIVLEIPFSDQPPWPAAADGAGPSLVLLRPSFGERDPRAWAASAFRGGSPGQPEPPFGNPDDHIVINEILAHTDLPQLDFLELHNRSPFEVDLSGCYLSDNPATNKFRLPDGTRLPPFGYVAFDEGQLGFGLSAAGETVVLFNPNLTRALDAVRFPGQANGLSWGRPATGALPWRELERPTPGLPNAPVARSPIVISELMFHPISGNSDDEFIEVHNRSTAIVDLSGWRFTDGLDYTFPANTLLQANAYLVIARHPQRLAAHYPGTQGPFLGPFSGQLDNGGESITLARPDTLLTTNANTQTITTNLYFIPVDTVPYGDGGRWGEWADGGGSSLELVDPQADGTLAPNWANSDESPKASWTTIETTGVLDHGVPSYPQADALHLMLLDRGEAVVDRVEVLVNGLNRVANSTFDTGLTGWAFSGTHRLSRWTASLGQDGTGGLHLVASGRGDHIANHARCRLTSPIPPGTTATIRARVRWLRGHPEILLRLRGNYLEASGALSVPTNLGTPAAPNSRRLPNAGPAITEITHRPTLPQAGQDVRVSARISDPDRLSSVRLQYRLDPAPSLTTITMTDDGLGADLVAGDGLYAGAIPGQLAGTLVAFRILATDAASPPVTSVFPTDVPRREALIRFGERSLPDTFGTYRVWITQANVDQWASRDKMSNEDLDVTFVAGAHRVIYNAGAHYSGSAYTSPGYNSPVGALCGYDLRTPEDDLYLGERHLTLDWPVRDATNQREQLMFWFLEQLGLPNLHRRSVHLFVNGLQRGAIYDDTQQPGDDVLSEWFPNDPDGSLFKTDCLYEFDDHGNRLDPCILNTLENFTTTGGLRKIARYRWNWRPRAIGATANDFRDLFTLVDAMNAPASNYLATVENLVDVEHWMRTFAMNDLASFWDAFGNPNAKNTFLYKPARAPWKLLSWDFDVGLGVFVDPVDAPLFPNLDDPTMNRFYTVPAFLRHYWRALEESVNTFFRPEAVTPILAAKYDAFQAAGIPLTSPFVPSGAFGLSIPDWIAQRRSFLLAELARVQTIFSISAPQSQTTNRSTITLSGTAPLAVATFTVNGAVFPATWTSVKTWTLSVPLALGTNVLRIAGLDRAGQPIANAIGNRTVISTATPPAPGQVVFNEWMADNAGAVRDPADGLFDDWFELFNPTDQPADLGGYWLSDDDLDPRRFVIPNGTLLPARGFLLVWADDQTTQTGTDLHVNFRLSKSGEILSLRDPSGRLVDRLEFAAQLEDVSEGCFPDGYPSPFVPLPYPTPGAPNARPAAPAIRVLQIDASAPGQITLTWTSAPGYLYRIQASSDLHPSSWTNLPGELTASGPSTALTIPVPADLPHHFYRVVALP